LFIFVYDTITGVAGTRLKCAFGALKPLKQFACVLFVDIVNYGNII